MLALAAITPFALWRKGEGVLGLALSRSILLLGFGLMVFGVRDGLLMDCLGLFQSGVRVTCSTWVFLLWFGWRQILVRGGVLAVPRLACLGFDIEV